VTSETFFFGYCGGVVALAAQERANQLAQKLRDLGINPDEI
jgi:Fe2+ transport system protein FeoA